MSQRKKVEARSYVGNRRARLRAQGLCPDCGALPDFNPKTGRRFERCALCRPAHNARCQASSARYRARRLAAGNI